VADPTDDQVPRILAALRADASPLRRRGVAMLVDFVLSRPLADFVDRDGLVELFTRGLDVDRAIRVLRSRAEEAWKRQLRRADDTELPVGALLPQSVRDRLRDVVAAAKPPRADWARGAIDPTLVRRIVAPALQDVLLAFTRRLPLPGLSGEAAWPGLGLMAGIGLRVREEIEKRAGQVADAGRAVLDGLGIDLEAQIEALTRDFSQSAERDLREALARRIETAEGRALVGEMQTQLFDRLLATRWHDLRIDLDGLPLADVAELIAPTLHHLRSEGFLAEALGEEIDAWLAADGARRVGELLREVGILDMVKEHTVGRGEQLARAFFASDEFGAWLADVLESGKSDGTS